ncbi:GWxTD domain-containing protein [Fodinibius halophilus]|uniref:GWxTD domain-containing protein n=1 Tax=Fodinibius halophilus TaxID=1736908 RepID=A0A6M1T3T5_9BACT|nr:GWxTD domain-containing protein [Fodinibius halophilus]NGP90076.1 GWxTD domain-containing protein [Fodinibius halophilus]
MHSFKNNLLLIFVASSLVFACSSSRNTNIKHGTGYNFKIGYPEFRTSSFGYVDRQGDAHLKISTHIVKGSLIYKKDIDSLKAKASISIQIVDAENPENIISEKHFKREVATLDEQINSSSETIELENTFSVPPSHYKILVTVTDLTSDKKITQEVTSYIPKTEQGKYSLSSIHMYGKNNEDSEWQRINTYDIKGNVDSLRFVFQIMSPQSKKSMELNSRLLRFESDTSYARPMHYSNYSPSSIEYKGIDYDKETELQSNKRVLSEYSSVFIEYKFAIQDRGNYRFQVTASKEGGEKEIFKARDFGIKSKNYPAVKSTKELARPLIYLMGEKRYEEFIAISDRDSLKKEIDRFWLKNIGSSARARDVIQLYYQRVEEANKQFSNFKEGWKTDLGMIYVLFGPPWYTEDRLNHLSWYYSYNREDPEYSFRFVQPKLKSKYFPFYHYIFKRNNFYYTIQYMQRELWLTGQIITRRL